MDRTHRAEKAISESAVVVGYKRYLDLIVDLTSGKQLISSGMTKETDRCRAAVEFASKGEAVSLVSSGDPGVTAWRDLRWKWRSKYPWASP